jgi:transcriptional regulator with XRE-family HTH domain
MPIDSAELSRRIRAAREACGLTQDEAARHLDLSRPSFAQLEGGKRSVSSLELDRLAALFGRDIRDFLRAEAREENVFSALFRAQVDAAERSTLQASLGECLALARELNKLESLVGVDRDMAVVTSYSLAKPTSRWQAIQQGERLASDERRRLGLGSRPVPDLETLLESEGIRTGQVSMPDDISGLTLSSEGVGLFVVVNQNHPLLRRRFSFAHEFSHVLADRDFRGLISRSSGRADLLEVRANAFAAAFLLPEDGVRSFVEALGKGKPSRAYFEVFDEEGSLDVEGRSESGSQTLQLYDVVQLAWHFAVSRLSVLYRLRNLRLLTEGEFDLLKRLDQAGRGKEIENLLGFEVPDRRPSEFRHRFLGLALEAYRRDEISRSKLRELAGLVNLDSDGLDQLLDRVGLARD